MGIRNRAASTVLLAFMTALVLPIAAAKTEPPYTPAERAAVDGLADSMEKQCKEELSQLPAEHDSPPSNNSLDNFDSAIRSGGYCQCIGTHFRADITPTLLRHGTQQETTAFSSSTAKNCAVAQFKTVWPGSCRAFTQRVATSASQNSEANKLTDEVCACVQPKVDAITGETLAETVRQTVADYKKYQQNPAATSASASTPLSLVAAIRSCIDRYANALPN